MSEESFSQTTNTSIPEKRFKVVDISWEHVSTPFIISIWIIFAGVSKIGLGLVYKFVSKVPESCILISLGLAVGGIAYIARGATTSSTFFDSNTFFLFILPPIVIEAGYFMPKRPFFANIGTILTYAVAGTIFNALAIGFSLYGVYYAGLMPGMDDIAPLDILQCLLFGTIISAVDPVAVISVFEEIHVNTVLYICVFGESLLNDGVVVVLYNIFQQFLELGQDQIHILDMVLALLSFFVVIFGALLIGMFFGYVCSFLTKYTTNNRVIEPTFVFVFCYASYLCAELFHLSGIICVVCAAFIMSYYVEQNISSKSHTTVKYGLKMLSNIAETTIFMLLGIVTISDFWEEWNTFFVLWTLLFILIYRTIGVYALTAMINYVRLEKINNVDQFVMAYGGLRGAIAFSLVSLSSNGNVPAVNTMICACIIVILFTSFVQGSTIRPIVELLHVKTASRHRKTMLEDMTLKLFDHLLAGIEDVIGYRGHNHWMNKLQEHHVRYVEKIFVRKPHKSRNDKLLETFHRMNKRDAADLIFEIERGKLGRSSSGDLRQALTLTSLLIPFEMRKTTSNTSIKFPSREYQRPEPVIDVNATNSKGHSQQENLKEADVHHLLRENMYNPKILTGSRFRRGSITEDDDSVTTQQVKEILMRHKVHPGRKRFKVRPSKTKLKGPDGQSHISSAKRVITTLTQSPTETRNANYFPSLQKHDDISFVASIAPRGPLGFLNVVREESVDTNEVPETGLQERVAIDRELPWKRTANDAESDPHVAEKVPTEISLKSTSSLEQKE